MSSYNLINGVQASENKDLLTGILRGEWDFKGMVTTDWWTHGEHYRETKAGNDIKMANGYEERVQEAFEKGYITRDEIALCAKRILTMILRMDYKGLGEMDPEQLWETTLNPETRLLKRVEIEDARMASDVTEVLMGTEVPPRKAFIYEHATDAELDI